MPLRFDDIGNRLKAFRLGSGLSAEEIAQTAGITSTGIRVRMLRARQVIREKTMAVSA